MKVIYAKKVQDCPIMPLVQPGCPLTDIELFENEKYWYQVSKELSLIRKCPKGDGVQQFGEFFPGVIELIVD